MINNHTRTHTENNTCILSYVYMKTYIDKKFDIIALNRPKCIKFIRYAASKKKEAVNTVNLLIRIAYHQI